MTKIKDFIDSQHLEELLLVKSIVKGATNNGSPYLTITLQDDSASIEAKMWDVKPEQIKLLEVGKVYKFSFDVINYRGTLQLKIISFNYVAQEEIEISDFVFKSSLTKNELRNIVNDYISNIENDIIRHIVTETVIYYEKDFYDYPAASKNHHNKLGGLASHVISMIKLAISMCELYPILNRDLLVGSIILHDIGKVEELGGLLVSEYTLKGKLLGHISIGAAKVFEIGNKLGYENSEELLLLRHMILSHHGQLEYGSPIRPQLIEAEVLNFIDNIDARINCLENAFNSIEYNSFTTRLFPLESRSFYKHDLNIKKGEQNELK